MKEPTMTSLTPISSTLSLRAVAAAALGLLAACTRPADPAASAVPEVKQAVAQLAIPL